MQASGFSNRASTLPSASASHISPNQSYKSTTTTGFDDDDDGQVAASLITSKKRPFCLKSPHTHPPTSMLDLGLFSPLTALASDMDSNLRMPETPPTPRRCLLKDLTAETPVASGIFGKLNHHRAFTRNNTTLGRVETSRFKISSSSTEQSVAVVEFAKPRPLDPSIFLRKSVVTTASSHWSARAPLLPPTKTQRRQQQQDEDHDMAITKSSSSFPPPNKIRRMTSLDSIVKQHHTTTTTTTTELSSMSAQLMAVPGEVYDLPCYYGADAMKRITPDTLSKLINGHYANKCDEVHIVDCRFPYEFQGGHIQTAKNYWTLEDLDQSFFENQLLDTSITPAKRAIVVMHCEYSAQRAPRMYKECVVRE